MKNELPNKHDAYAKVMRVIRSCKTPSHIKVARQMIANFFKLFNMQEYYELSGLSGSINIQSQFSKDLNNELYKIETEIYSKTNEP